MITKRFSAKDINKLEMLLRLGGAALRVVLRHANQGKIDPVTAHLVLAIGRMETGEASLLAWGAFRYKELDQIDVRSWAGGQNINIRQTKTDQPRGVTGISTDDRLEFSDVEVTESMRIVNYDSLHYAIANSMPIRLREVLSGCQNKTHVFRHLRASWMLQQGSKLYQIQKFFGHKNSESTEQYIHEALFPVFDAFKL